MVRAIVGRLADLGLRELFRLLNSAGAEGSLEVECPDGRARLLFQRGNVSGEVSAGLVAASSTRTGKFAFRPEEVGEVDDWVPQELFLAHLESRVAVGGAAVEGRSAAAQQEALEDPLSELRESLAEVVLPGEATRLLVMSADPRPYRNLITDWRHRGWQATLQDTAAWPEGIEASLLIVHVPVSGTLAGQGEGWLAALRTAVARQPRVPVLWVGGVNDPWLRHQVIMAGADFVVPAPAADVGETARWFRQELTMLAERLLARRSLEIRGEAEAFRDFFVALHADATPAETRASLLRFSGNYFERAALFAVTDEGFESLGSFGFAVASGARVSRGAAPLEDVVVERRTVELDSYPQKEVAALARALGVKRFLRGAEVFPMLAASDCVGVFVGDGVRQEAGGTSGLGSLLVRSGMMLASG
jgi:hypothetical protein